MTLFLFFIFFYLFAIFILHSRESDVSLCFWTVSPHSLGSCHFRVTCLPHKGGASRASGQVSCPRTQQAILPSCSPQPPINAERQAGKL